VELFDTTPDLTGNDLDVSRYVRETDGKDIQVYWREIPEEGLSKEMTKPNRSELCSVPIGEIKEIISKNKEKHLMWMWDHLDETPIEITKNTNLLPGMTIMLDTQVGGYTEKLGWIGKEWKKSDGEVKQLEFIGKDENESTSSEKETFIGKEVSIYDHCKDVSVKCGEIASSTGFEGLPMDQIQLGGLWHDIGKAHEAFQNALNDGMVRNALLAKSRERRNRMEYFVFDGGEKKYRRYFRHELASALALLQNENISMNDKKLAAYLVGSHHGKVRQSIRSLPDETEPNDFDIKFARGVWDGDVIPSVEGILDSNITLDLSPMEMGEGSWLEMSLDLLDEYGPFKLAYLESIIRISDWVVSAGYDAEVRK
jgi:CRISPR-associated endonuclease/helicase Cas3